MKFGGERCSTFHLPPPTSHPMTLARRCTFWFSLALIAAASMVWILSVPYQPQRLFAAIPANAMLVAEIDRPAARLAALAGDPAVRRLARPLTLPEEWIDGLQYDSGMRRILDRLGARRAVAAYLPHLDGAKGADAWVFASWIGGQSQRLRWQAGLGFLTGLREVRFPEGDRVWLVQHSGDFGGPRRLSLAISEGVLLGCWSANPTGARFLLETIDGRAGHPSVVTAGRWAVADTAWPENSLLRGWLDFDHAAGVPAIAWALTQAGEARIAGECSCVLPPPGMAGAATLQRGSAAALAPLLGDAADAVALLPAALLRRFLPGNLSLEIEALGFPLEASNVLALAVLDNRHSGRLRGVLGFALPFGLKGLKTLTALAGDWVGAGAALDQGALQTALGSWNKRWRTGLHAHPLNPAVPAQGVRFEEALPGFYHAFEPDEQAALVATNGWRIAATHAGALRACLGAAGSDSFVPRWRGPGARHLEAAGWFWLNPAGLGESSRGLLALINMANAGGGASAVALRRRIGDLSAALAVLDEMAGAEGWLVTTGRLARLHWTVDRKIPAAAVQD